MSETEPMQPMTDEDVRLFLSRCEEAGKHIDPATAEVEWEYIQTLDPYGVHPDLPEECWQVERGYFARSPGSDLWVWFGDLPEATRTALWEKHQRKLVFPAGFESLLDAGHRRSEIDDPEQHDASGERRHDDWDNFRTP